MTPLACRVPFLLLFIIILGAERSASQTHTLHGSILDRTTGEPLPAATIRILGTDKGTIANAEGSFQLSLPEGRYSVVASFVGYAAETLSVNISAPLERTVYLRPSPILLPEVVVIGEDPAISIMRKVIERKKEWRDSLRTYTMEAFSRQTIRRDTAIVTISESYTSGYWRSGDTLREVVRQKRSTANIPAERNFASVGQILNFYEDDVRLAGFDFIGPTSTEAFEYYDFRLEQTRDVDGRSIFVISLNPTTRLTPLFIGTVSVVDERFVLASVDVRPNEAFQIPLVPDFLVTYGQQFAPVRGKFWLPVDIRTHAEAKIDIMGFSFPRFVLDAVSTIYNYEPNAPVPDSLFQKRRLQVDSNATVFDSTYWREREVLPQTSEERKAFATIDSTQTMDKAFRPSGPLAEMDSAGVGFLEYADIRYDRVVGVFLGGVYSVDSLFGSTTLTARAGYGPQNKRGQGGLKVDMSVGTPWKLSVGLSAERRVIPLYDEGVHIAFENSLAALISREDYFDYAWITGGEVRLSAKPFRSLDAKVSIRHDRWRNATQHSVFSLFYRGQTWRPNPAIDEGTIRSLRAHIRYGDAPVPFNLIQVDALELESEFSSRTWKSEFAYARHTVRATYRINTFLRRSLFPSHLALSASGGTSTGSLPLQRAFSPETQLAGVAPFGTLRAGRPREFAGDRFLVASLEHNFRNAFFLWLGIPYLYESQVETILFCTAASVSGPPRYSGLGSPTSGTYVECGLGLNRILKLFRVDLTYRFYAPHGLHLTLSAGQLL